MKTYKNKNFKTRDYEATNVVACQGNEAPNANWIEANESIIQEMKLNQLWIENNVRYFGWL